MHRIVLGRWLKLQGQFLAQKMLDRKQYYLALYENKEVGKSPGIACKIFLVVFKFRTKIIIDYGFTDILYATFLLYDFETQL